MGGGAHPTPLTENHHWTVFHPYIQTPRRELSVWTAHKTLSLVFDIYILNRNRHYGVKQRSKIIKIYANYM